LNFVLKQYRYHQRWLEALQGAYLDPEVPGDCHFHKKKGFISCNGWAITVAGVMRGLGANPDSLKRLESVFFQRALDGCVHCKTQFDAWRMKAMRQRDSIPPFTTFV
jgi:hypothetical protein